MFYQYLSIYYNVVGCLKITEDKASDANLADAKVAFQPQTRAPCQTRGSCLNPNADLAAFIKRKGHVPTSDVNLQSLPNTMVVLFFETQTLGSRFNIKTRAYVASHFNTNACLRSFAFQLQCESVSSAFQHRRDPVSSAFQHQSEAQAQREPVFLL